MPEYNGWASYETWLVNLWFGDYLSNYFEDNREAVSGDDVENVIEEYIDETCSESRTGFVADIINAALREVDWEELAEHVNDDLDLEDED